MQTTTDVSSSATTASRDEVQSTEGPGAFRFEGGSYHTHNTVPPLQQQMQNAMLSNAPT